MPRWYSLRFVLRPKHLGKLTTPLIRAVTAPPQAVQPMPSTFGCQTTSANAARKIYRSKIEHRASSVSCSFRVLGKRFVTGQNGPPLVAVPDSSFTCGCCGWLPVPLEVCHRGVMQEMALRRSCDDAVMAVLYTHYSRMFIKRTGYHVAVTAGGVTDHIFRCQEKKEKHSIYRNFSGKRGGERLQTDVLRTGGFGAAITAVLYIVVSVNYYLWPSTATPEQLMRVLVDNPTYHYVETLGFALISLMLIPVVTAFGELLQPVHAGFSRWAMVIGYISCAGAIISRLRMIQLVPLRAAVFLEGDETIRAAIQYNWLGNSIDPHGWLQFGCFGIWLLIVSCLVLRHGAFPRKYGYLSLAGAVVNMLVLASDLGAPLPGQILAALAGIVVGPAWSLWTAVLLIRWTDGLQRIKAL